MWRVLLWLLPDVASLPASEREPMDRGMVFAAVGVLLSVLFNKEKLKPWQAIGVAASGVGVALMALG